MRSDSIVAAMRVWIAVATAAVVLGSGGRSAAQEPGAESAPIILERILVKVNGEILTQSELEDRQVAEIRSRGVQPRTNAELRQLVNEVTPGVIASAVDEMLLVQRGRELGYSLSDDQFDEIVADLREENGFATTQELAEALEQAEGLSMDDLRRLMERQVLVSQVQQIEILNRFSITDVEAREYYEAHQDEFTIPAEAAIREILIEVPDGAAGLSGGDAEARTVAETTLNRLRAGEDFAAVAADVSDSPSASNGGLVGPLLVSDYSEAIQQVIRSLDDGEISDVRQTPAGYQIVMLEEHREATVRPFAEVREEIANNVFNDRRLTEYSAYLEKLRQDAIIEWKNDELKRVYERHIATRSDPIIQPGG